MYQETKWQDQIKDVNTGELIQEGTDQSAGNFNNLEHGVSDVHLAALILSVGMLPAIRANEVEVIEVTLKNTSKSIPFNNSTQSIALANKRDSANYDVEIQVVEATGTGIVGVFDITDKMLNGFKLAYSGSAASVTVKLTIKGGSN
jgi:hypothetical protein